MRHPSEHIQRSAIRLAVHGAKGRMGARLCALARDDARFELVAAIDVDGPLMRDGELRGAAIDAVIDFSSDAGAAAAAALALEHGAALLVGTTALAQTTVAAIDTAARRVPVMIAPNTSLGVAVLNHLAAEAARLLGPAFTVELVETHHAGKLDAPSGTAKRLLQTLKDRADLDVPPQRVRSIREGDEIGLHELEFTGPGENLKISHAATSRDVFALGALRAMLWLRGQKPGQYAIEQAWGVEK